MLEKTLVSCLLFLQVLMMLQSQLASSYGLRRSPGNLKSQSASSYSLRRSPGSLKVQVVEEENSPALNNFLENVLKAKDELKWIDKTINAGVFHKRRSKRRLLWSRREKERLKRRDEDIETILGDLGFSGENSPGSRSIQDNSHVERRRYPVPDLTGTGVIEYYDYEGDVGKRDSLGASNVTTTANELETIKKEGITEEKSGQSSTLPYPRQEFITDRVELPKSKKFIVDLNDQEDGEAEGSDVELINDENGVGRHNRCHRVKDNGMFLHSHFLEIQEFEIIPPQADQNLRSTKAINPGRTFFILSPVNSPEENNSMTSGSDYQALKVTDDMFKGGIEQGNSFDESPSIHFNSKDLENDNHWKSIQEKNETPKEIELKLNRKNAYPHEIHLSIVNKDKPESNKGSREKRSSAKLGPIMRHESIVEPFNWPWEDYDSNDNTRIRFGRALMQASQENPIITNLASEKIPSDSLSSEDILQDFGVFWRSRALTYLHTKRHQQFFRGNEKFVKNHASPFGTEKRVKRGSDEVTRENSRDESQMNLAVHGEIAEKIVDKIFEQVQKNEHLSATIGSGLSRRSKSQGVPAEKEPEADPEEIKRTGEIMKKVIELLGHLVSNEVHRKSCTKLPPHLHEFLVWMVGDEEASRDTTVCEVFNYYFSSEEKSPVTPARDKENEKNSKPSKFLFPSTQRPESEAVDPNDLHRKVRLLKNLIKEYHALTEKEQTKVQTVADYLERQLHLLLKYIASKEAAKKPTRRENRNSLYYHSLFSEPQNDNKLLELHLKSNGFRGRKRRQAERHRKIKKKRKKKKKNEKHRRKKLHKNHKLEHVRRKRSANEGIDWEIPKIFYPNDINYLSNVTTSHNAITSSPFTVTVDDELNRLFKDTRVRELIPQNDKFISKSDVISPVNQTLSPLVTIGSRPKIESDELLNSTKSSTAIESTSSLKIQ